jgi:5'(3')-deoxyribonucleotidase
MIALDLDSTLNNLLEVWLRFYNDDHQDNIKPENILTWDTHQYVKIGKKIYSYLNNPLVYQACTPLPRSQDVVKELHTKYGCVIVSACARGTHDAKKDWCVEHFPGVPFIATHSKECIRAALIIDDKIETLQSFPGAGICFNQPYNQEWTGLRVKHWFEVPSLVESILSDPV